MAVYGYCRVSTGRQAEDGESLGVQQRQIEGYALMHGLSVDGLYVERGVSGSVPIAERPEGGRMWAGLRAGDVVIVSRMDRAFRSALDALGALDWCRAQGVALHMIDLGGDVVADSRGRLVFTILSAVAEAERERIRERVAETKADQRARGRYLGGAVPLGKAVGEDGELVDDPQGAAAVALMRELHGLGYSLRRIAHDVGERTGVRVSHAGVAKALRRG